MQNDSEVINTANLKLLVVILAILAPIYTMLMAVTSYELYSLVANLA